MQQYFPFARCREKESVIKSKNTKTVKSYKERILYNWVLTAMCNARCVGGYVYDSGAEGGGGIVFSFIHATAEFISFSKCLTVWSFVSIYVRTPLT